MRLCYVYAGAVSMTPSHPAAWAPMACQGREHRGHGQVGQCEPIAHQIPIALDELSVSRVEEVPPEHLALLTSRDRRSEAVEIVGHSELSLRIL